MIHLGTNAVWYPPAQHALQHQQPWDKGTEERTKSLNICWWVPAQSHPGVLHPPPPASPTAPGQPLGTIFAAGRQRQDRWWPNRMDAVPKGAASLPGWGETYLVPANGGHETRSLDHSQANLLSVNTRPPFSPISKHKMLLSPPVSPDELKGSSAVVAPSTAASSRSRAPSPLLPSVWGWPAAKP